MRKFQNVPNMSAGLVLLAVRSAVGLAAHWQDDHLIFTRRYQWPAELQNVMFTSKMSRGQSRNFFSWFTSPTSLLGFLKVMWETSCDDRRPTPSCIATPRISGLSHRLFSSFWAEFGASILGNPDFRKMPKLNFPTTGRSTSSDQFSWPRVFFVDGVWSWILANSERGESSP